MIFTALFLLMITQKIIYTLVSFTNDPNSAVLIVSGTISIMCLKLAPTVGSDALLKALIYLLPLIYLLFLLLRLQTSIRLFQLPCFLGRGSTPLNKLFFSTNTFSAFDPLRTELCFLEVWPQTTTQNLSIWTKSRFTSILSTGMNGPLAKCNFFTSHAQPLLQSL